MKKTLMIVALIALVAIVLISFSVKGSGVEIGDQLIAKQDFSLRVDTPLLAGPERCSVSKGERIYVVQEGQYSNGSAGLTPLVKLSAEHCSGWVINDSSLNRLLEKP